jgi:hypothetical protein
VHRGSKLERIRTSEGLKPLQCIARSTGACRVIITASEDQTCRFWHAYSGAMLSELTTHRGRGVWCCSSVSPTVLLTGGSDGAVRLWDLPSWLPSAAVPLLQKELAVRAVGSGGAGAFRQTDKQEGVALSLHLPGTLSSEGVCAHAAAAPGSSGADSVRGMALAGLRCLYAITKAGRLHCALLNAPAPAAHNATRLPPVATWHCLWNAPPGDAPLNCLSVTDGPLVASLVIGAQSGFVTFLEIRQNTDRGRPDVLCIARVRPCGALPVLGVFGLASLPLGHLLYSSIDNVLRWVIIPGILGKQAEGQEPLSGIHGWRSGAAAEAGICCTSTAMSAHQGTQAVMMVAQGCTERASRIVSADVMVARGVVVVGDVSGGVCVFSFPPSLVLACSESMQASTKSGMHSGEELPERDCVGVAVEEEAAQMGPASRLAVALALEESGQLADAFPRQVAMEDQTSSLHEEAEHGYEWGPAGRGQGNGARALQLQLVAKLGSCHGNTPVTMVKCFHDRALTGGRNGALRSFRLPEGLRCFVCMHCLSGARGQSAFFPHFSSVSVLRGMSRCLQATCTPLRHRTWQNQPCSKKRRMSKAHSCTASGARSTTLSPALLTYRWYRNHLDPTRSSPVLGCDPLRSLLATTPGCAWVTHYLV